MQTMVYVALCGLAMLAGNADDAPADRPVLRVKHFPESGYRNERLCFAAEAPSGQEVNVRFRDKIVARADPSGGTIEFNLALDNSGILTFTQGTNEISFHVVQPMDPVRLREEQGYLYSEQGPAILLAPHLSPPKHSRKWETLRVIRSWFSDARPTARTGLLAAESALLDKAGLPPNGAPLAFWKRADIPACRSEILSLIVNGTNGLSHVDVALVALAGRDLDQGIHPLDYRIKLEWYVQRLRLLDIPHLFVVLPVISPLQEAQSRRLIGALRIAMQGNLATLLTGRMNEDPLADAKSVAWLPSVERRIAEWVKTVPARTGQP